MPRTPPADCLVRCAPFGELALEGRGAHWLEAVLEQHLQDAEAHALCALRHRCLAEFLEEQ